MLVLAVMSHIKDYINKNYPSIIIHQSQHDDYYALYHESFSITGYTKKGIIEFITKRLVSLELGDPTLISSLESLVSTRLKQWKDYNDS